MPDFLPAAEMGDNDIHSGDGLHEKDGRGAKFSNAKIACKFFGLNRNYKILIALILGFLIIL